MGIAKYKLINEDKKIGVWIDTIDLINLIKICNGRSNFYKKRLIKIYEDLEGTTFKEELIKKSG